MTAPMPGGVTLQPVVVDTDVVSYLFVNAPLITHNPNDYAGVPGLTVFSSITP